MLPDTIKSYQTGHRLKQKSVDGLSIHRHNSPHCHQAHQRHNASPVGNPLKHPICYPAKNLNEAGFTLIELIAVLILVGLLAVTAISRWDNATISLSAQAEQIASDIRYTQMISMTQGQRFRINFSANRYWISNINDSTQILHPASNSSDVFLNTGITLSSSNSYLVFNGNGTPYSNASLPGTPLAGNASITLTAGSETRVIEVRPETGRVSLL